MKYFDDLSDDERRLLIPDNCELLGPERRAFNDRARTKLSQNSHFGHGNVRKAYKFHHPPRFINGVEVGCVKFHEFPNYPAKGDFSTGGIDENGEQSRTHKSNENGRYSGKGSRGRGHGHGGRRKGKEAVDSEEAYYESLQDMQHYDSDDYELVGFDEPEDYYEFIHSDEFDDDTDDGDIDDEEFESDFDLDDEEYESEFELDGGFELINLESRDGTRDEVDEGLPQEDYYTADEFDEDEFFSDSSSSKKGLLLVPGGTQKQSHGLIELGPGGKEKHGIFDFGPQEKRRNALHHEHHSFAVHEL